MFTSDGGGVVQAARMPLHGADRVARAWLALARGERGRTAAFVEVNGATGLLTEAVDGTRSVVVLTLDGGRIVRIDVVRNPAKLGHVGSRG